jgi:hypothetical protein
MNDQNCELEPTDEQIQKAWRIMLEFKTVSRDDLPEELLRPIEQAEAFLMAVEKAELERFERDPVRRTREIAVKLSGFLMPLADRGVPRDCLLGATELVVANYKTEIEQEKAAVRFARKCGKEIDFGRAFSSCYAGD